MHSFVSHLRAHQSQERPAAHRDARQPQIRTWNDRRVCPRIAISFPLEFGVLPWFRHWLLRPAYQTIRSIDRNPTGSLAVPDPEPWAHPYLTVARCLGKLLFINGTRCWHDEGKISAANGLDLSQSGLRMATAYPLWVGASLHLRVPASELTPFGYTVLGKVVRIIRRDLDEVEVGVAFTGIHPSDSHELPLFLLTPLPKLATLRRQGQQPAPQPRAGEPVEVGAP